MTRIRIAPDGTVRALWTDDIDWQSIGPVTVERASQVEFCQRRQQWYVQIARPRGWLRWVIQRIVGRPCGEILYWADTRQMALAWEQQHFDGSGYGRIQPVKATALVDDADGKAICHPVDRMPSTAGRFRDS